MLNLNLATKPTFNNYLYLADPYILLRNDIASLFASEAQSNILMNKVALRLQQFGAEGLKAVIKTILQDENLLVSTAADSYLHKNGFYKILLSTHKDFVIRLHIWMPGVTSHETLHNHGWHIASTILTGKLQSEIWQESASTYAQAYDEYMYTSKHADPILIGKVKVEPVETVVHQAGDAYVLQPHVLHRIMSQSDKMIATLICRSSHVQSWARNIIVNSYVPDVKPNYLTPQELAQVLEQYLLLTA